MAPALLERQLLSVDLVRCLWCGELYDKPLREVLAPDEAGCPVCGYAGWAEPGTCSSHQVAVCY